MQGTSRYTETICPGSAAGMTTRERPSGPGAVQVAARQARGMVVQVSDQLQMAKAAGNVSCRC